MADDSPLAVAEAELSGFTRAHRAFFIPVVRAISELDGRARKRDVVLKIRDLLADEFTQKQLDYLEANNRFGWARLDLKNVGLVAGEYGWWELTPLGTEYATKHESADLTVGLDIPEAKEPAPRNQQTETVEVTAFPAYEIPALEVLASGTTDRAVFMEALLNQLKSTLKPGDFRLMPRGTPVWKFRTAWSLSNLGKKGFAENTGLGKWIITPAGRSRLADERETWSISSFPSAKAKVRVSEEIEPPPPGPEAWDVAKAWTKLSRELGKAQHSALDQRLAPTAGPSADGVSPRNLILYGPPGTGKTHVAKRIAHAFTGQADPDDEGRFRLVQFHPSYAYEDFIQGLRPDTRQTTLRYELAQGPFSRIAQVAEQDPDNFYVLVIDEINRGDPARIFGELMYALEYRGEPITLALGGTMVVPPNLVIIGTMNSVDRSVALVDYALRRRFGFVRVDPNPDVISTVRSPGAFAELAPGVLDKFNDWIDKRLDRDHQIGHSYFLSANLPETAEAFTRVWDMDIRPLLEEYFFGDVTTLELAEKRWRDIVAAELSDRQKLVEEDESSEDLAAP